MSLQSEKLPSLIYRDNFNSFVGIINLGRDFMRRLKRFISFGFYMGCLLLGFFISKLLFSRDAFADIPSLCVGKGCLLANYDGKTKPCLKSTCSLPPDFYSHISVCSPSEQQSLITYIQDWESFCETFIYGNYQLSKYHLISLQTQQKIKEFVTWQKALINEPLQTWPHGASKELLYRGKQILADIRRDEHVAPLYRFLCYFSNKYCW